MHVKPPKNRSASVFLFHKSATISFFTKGYKKCKNWDETLTKFQHTHISSCCLHNAYLNSSSESLFPSSSWFKSNSSPLEIPPVSLSISLSTSLSPRAQISATCSAVKHAWTLTRRRHFENGLCCNATYAQGEF